MHVETMGEHTVKFEDKAMMEGIVNMLKGNSSKPVWVAVTAHGELFWVLFLCFLQFILKVNSYIKYLMSRSTVH